MNEKIEIIVDELLEVYDEAWKMLAMEPEVNDSMLGNSYPSDKEIETVENWKFDDFFGLIEYLQIRWKWSDYIRLEPDGSSVAISTGGWSGHETLIGALKRNKNHWWMMYWRSSERGGHYVFEPRPEELRKFQKENNL